MTHVKSVTYKALCEAAAKPFGSNTVYGAMDNAAQSAILIHESLSGRPMQGARDKLIALSQKTGGSITEGNIAEKIEDLNQAYQAIHSEVTFMMDYFKKKPDHAFLTLGRAQKAPIQNYYSLIHHLLPESDTEGRGAIEAFFKELKIPLQTPEEIARKLPETLESGHPKRGGSHAKA